MANWMYNLALAWVQQHKIKDLEVVIEAPIMNSSERGVVTLMTQMRLITAYEEAFYRLQDDLPDVNITLGEAHNQTVKKVFTGNGNADKTIMVLYSVWSKRPDVQPREHLADAQAMSMCSVPMMPMNDMTMTPMKSSYEDHAIGQGPDWKGRL